LYLPEGSFIRAQRADSSYFYPAVAEQGEILYRFSTTRRVDLSFVRGRVSQRLMRLMERGTFDSLLLRDIRSVYNYPLGNRLLMRLGIADEVGHVRYRAQNYINGLMQSVMTDNNDTRG